MPYEECVGHAVRGDRSGSHRGHRVRETRHHGRPDADHAGRSRASTRMPGRDLGRALDGGEPAQVGRLVRLAPSGCSVENPKLGWAMLREGSTARTSSYHDPRGVGSSTTCDQRPPPAHEPARRGRRRAGEDDGSSSARRAEPCERSSGRRPRETVCAHSCAVRPSVADAWPWAPRPGVSRRGRAVPCGILDLWLYLCRDRSGWPG